MSLINTVRGSTSALLRRSNFSTHMAAPVLLQQRAWYADDPSQRPSNRATKDIAQQQLQQEMELAEKEREQQGTTIPGTILSGGAGAQTGQGGARLQIMSYSPKGFKISGIHYRGPVVLSGRYCFLWNCRQASDISVESMKWFFLLEPRPETLVIGTGNRIEQIDPDVQKALREAGIKYEVQDTRSACSTYNLLTVENRIISAALIPPVELDPSVTPRQPKRLRDELGM
eukprot:Clim_evm7s162 gene=Clim_evmTU7s162